MAENQSTGSIVCVGVGMTLGSHIGPLCKNYIINADVVFTGVSHILVEQWIQGMNKDVRSLQPYYADGKDRRTTYMEMVEVMMKEVRAGKKVVGAFYGHPGVFAWAPHKVIEEALSEGYEAHMEPGISAEDCLYADMGIDPGSVGCMHLEASQFMFYKRIIDPGAWLILWQVGLAGDMSISTFHTKSAYREVLTELLLKHYPHDHKVALYECATLPVDDARVDWMPLSEFASAEVSQITTMVIPPAKPLTRNELVLEKLSQIENS